MDEYKFYSDEQIEQAKNADLEDFLHSYGYELKQTSRDEVKIPHYGGLIITPSKNTWSWLSRPPAPDQKPGAKCLGGVGAYSFCTRALGMGFKEAMQAIVGEASEVKQFVPQNNVTQKENQEFIMPEKASSYKNLYAYLIKERKLDAAIINEFVKKGLMYQTSSEHTTDEGKTYKNENIVFLHKTKDGTICGASEQGTISSARFKKNYSGTDKDYGFVYKKGYVPDKVVYLFEAPIDLMSFVQLHPEITNAHFVAMEGLKPSIAEHYINDDWLVYSCVDNDNAGKAFNDKILSKKMAEAFGGKCEQITVSDREPPIEYLEAEHNGKKINLFLSDEDYKNCKSFSSTISGTSFVWKNDSRFSVITECKENGVKDFNDLLKKRCTSFSNDRESKNDESKDGDSLVEKIENVNNVATKIADAIDNGELDINKDERSVDSQNR